MMRLERHLNMCSVLHGDVLNSKIIKGHGSVFCFYVIFVFILTSHLHLLSLRYFFLVCVSNLLC